MKFSAEHIGLPAIATAALKDWYVKTLGARVLFQNDQSPASYFVSLGPVILEIYPATGSSADTANNFIAGFRHLAVQVANLELAREFLEKKGVQFVDPIKPAGGGGRVLFFRDCEQNVLHLVERPAGSLFLHET